MEGMRRLCAGEIEPAFVLILCNVFPTPLSLSLFPKINRLSRLCFEKKT